MKLLVCPDKFKGSLTAQEACCAIRQGLWAVFPASQAILLPLSDGGEGFAEIIGNHWGAEVKTATASDPLFRPINASYYFLPAQHTAIIEMAEASGLQRLATFERNPLHTSSFGTGQLIKAAMQEGATKIYLGLGGSATHDGGCGMAAALGFQFLNEQGDSFIPTGNTLSQIRQIDGTVFLKENKVEVEVLVDVRNPFVGKDGAAYTFAAQKGASEVEITLLEQGSIHLLTCWEQRFGIDLSKEKGGGAAGGMGAGCLAFLKARLRQGTDFLFEALAVEKNVAQSDLIITGEGRFDVTSFHGKVVGQLLSLAKKHRKPIWILAGQVTDHACELAKAQGARVKLISDQIPKEEAMANAEKLLSNAVAYLMKGF